VFEFDPGYSAQFATKILWQPEPSVDYTASASDLPALAVISCPAMDGEKCSNSASKRPTSLLFRFDFRING
jgi:hypothetical protein